MARPLRIEAAGAYYHVGARGNNKTEVFASDEDRHRFLAVLGDVVDRYGWRLYAYCLMGNHYHLALSTPRPNLGAGMGRLNQLYVQWFNRRYNRTGHLFERRYWAVLVENEAHMLALIRYIAANPVRAGLCPRPRDWPWSSAQATAGLISPPPFLDVEWVLSQFAADTGAAAAVYAQLVGDGAWPRFTGPGPGS